MMQTDEFTALNEKLDLVLTHVDGVKEEVTELKREVTGVKEEVTGLRKVTTGVQRELGGLKDELAEFRSDNRQEHQEMNGRLVEIAALVQTLDQERLMIIHRQDRLEATLPKRPL